MGKQKVNCFFVLDPVFSKLIAQEACMTELRAHLLGRFEDGVRRFNPVGCINMVHGDRIYIYGGCPFLDGHRITDPMVGWIIFPLHQESDDVIVLHFLNPKLVICMRTK